MNKIYLYHFCFNENIEAIDIIKDKLDFFDRIHWNNLCTNPNAFDIISHYKDKIHIMTLCRNNSEQEMEIIEKEISTLISFDWFLLNTNPCAIYLLEKYPSNINKFEICKNPNTIKLIIKRNILNEQDEHYINVFGGICKTSIWDGLSSNPNAIHIIEKNLDKLDEKCWTNLSKNPNAIHIIEKNKEKIDWMYIYGNPSIFTYDYELIKQIKHDINKSITEWIWKPSNRLKWNDWLLC